MSKVKTKLVTHHFTYKENLFSERPSLLEALGVAALFPFKVFAKLCFFIGTGIIRSVYLVFQIVIKSSYLVGLILTYPVSLLFSKKEERESRAKIEKTTTSIREKFTRLRNPQIAYGLVVFIILSLGSVSSFNLAKLYTNGQALKGKILGSTSSALEELTRGQDFLKNQETESAAKAFDKALFEFASSREAINNAGLGLNLILAAVPSKQDGDRLLRAGELLSDSAKKITLLYDQTKNFKLGLEGVEGSAGATYFTELSKTLDETYNMVTEAGGLLMEVNPDNVPAEYRQKFIDQRILVVKVAGSFKVFNELVSMASELFSRQRNFVVFFQNNNELRTTGGFPGSFADFDLVNAKIENLRVGSIYDLDGQLKDRYLPPLPLFMISNYWYLRDSNWFVNFPDSAKLMSEFYNKTSGKHADVIMTITPNVVIDILKITGPIYMEDYGVTLDADNFIEQTQVETSLNYDKLENKPKKLLGDLLPVLLEKISSMEKDNMFLALASIQNNLDTGNIMLYSEDESIQSKFSQFGWTGEIKNTDRDFLLVSRSNLGGNKTDTYIKDSLDLSSEIQPDGSILNTLVYTLSNPLPPIDKLSSTSFVRFVVPSGSTLISAEGFSEDPYKIDFEIKGEFHPAALKWQENAVRDISSNTYIGKESNKTYFANWLIVPGGESKTVTLKYQLPFLLQDLDHMSLIVQKQPGSNPTPFTYSLNTSGRIVHWKNFTSSEDGDSLTAEQSLSKASFYGAVLENRTGN